MYKGPEAEFQEIDSAGNWAAVYNRIRHEASMVHDFPCKEAKRRDNRERNRYRDVSPYDHSRLILERKNLDYINASLVLSPQETHRRYILTQGPLSSTCGHFWLMIWEQNSKAVLMLNRVIEKGQVKCAQYFPMGSDNEHEDEMIFDDVELKVTYMGEQQFKNYIIRTLEIEDLHSGQTKEVVQFHYTTWPDFGVPTSPEAFLQFLFAVRETGVLEDNVGPAVIHCSAGIGRSGTFCLVDTVLKLIEKDGHTGNIDVQGLLMDMRQYRMGLIQTADQLRFSYLAIIEGAKQILGGTANSISGSLDSGIEVHRDSNSSRSNTENTPAELDSEDDDDDEDLPREPPPPPPRVRPQTGYGNRTRPQPVVKENGASSSNGSRPPTPPPRVTSEISSSSRTTEPTEEVIPPGPSHNDIDFERKRKEGVEIRRRQREERKKKTSEQIQKMKTKQESSERWKARKSQMKPYIIGLSIAAVVGGYLLYRYYFS